MSGYGYGYAYPYHGAGGYDTVGGTGSDVDTIVLPQIGYPMQPTGYGMVGEQDHQQYEYRPSQTTMQSAPDEYNYNYEHAGYPRPTPAPMTTYRSYGAEPMTSMPRQHRQQQAIVARPGPPESAPPPPLPTTTARKHDTFESSSSDVTVVNVTQPQQPSFSQQHARPRPVMGDYRRGGGAGWTAIGAARRHGSVRGRTAENASEKSVEGRQGPDHAGGHLEMVQNGDGEWVLADQDVDNRVEQ
ncbi:hypothetical protein HK104_010778 [Borealophlyctis nickersoniae]|nr:hypothetical protein HK104_010778 [Borealophlyctis nickersoniae]